MSDMNHCRILNTSQQKKKNSYFFIGNVSAIVGLSEACLNFGCSIGCLYCTDSFWDGERETEGVNRRKKASMASRWRLFLQRRNN